MKKIHKALSFSDFGSLEKENVSLRLNFRNKTLNSSSITNTNKINSRKAISKMKILSCEDLQNHKEYNNEVEKIIKARKKDVSFYFDLILKFFVGKHFH